MIMEDLDIFQKFDGEFVQRYVKLVSNHFIVRFYLSDCHVSDSDAGPYVSREFKAEATRVNLADHQTSVGGKMCASKWF